MSVTAHDHPASAREGTGNEFIVIRVFVDGFRQGSIRKDPCIRSDEILTGGVKSIFKELQNRFSLPGIRPGRASTPGHSWIPGHRRNAPSPARRENFPASSGGPPKPEGSGLLRRNLRPGCRRSRIGTHPRAAAPRGGSSFLHPGPGGVFRFPFPLPVSFSPLPSILISIWGLKNIWGRP